ncbi:hypothetical protein DFH09DRAFT_1171453 [Mycena vulgaris]|nr:hypothetical protein DFH09DRAFT_1171453 [Mycena vulgaris]
MAEGAAIASPASNPDWQSTLPLELVEGMFEDLGSACTIAPAESGSSTANMQELRLARTSLLAAALTCKGFYPIALEILWRTLDNLTPLLKLLPSFTALDGVYTLFRTITSADWGQFDKYADYVRRVVHRTNSPSIEIHPSVYVAISVLHPRPILPNLKSVVFPASESRSSPNPCPDNILFAVPTLLEVELSSPALSKAFIATFLATLGGTSPNLSSLRICGQSFIVLQRTLSSLAQLKMLDLANMSDTVSAGALLCIAALKHLHSLSIDLSSPSPVMLVSVPERPGDDRFPALKSLHIRFNRPRSVTEFFTFIPTGRLLHTLTINAQSLPAFHPVPQSDIIDAIFREIPSRWASSLQYLELSNFPLFTRNHLHQLLKLDNLRTFRLRNIMVPITATDIPVVASAWPYIRACSLPLTTGIPIGSLHHFAKHWPELTELEIKIATVNLPPFTTTPVYSHALRTLDLGDSPCSGENIRPLSRHLDRLFPKLRFLRASGPDKSRWEEVEGWLFTLQDVRKHAVAQS